MKMNSGLAMAQAISSRPFTEEARVRSRVIPRGIYGGQSGTGTGFSPSTSVLPCQIPPVLHYKEKRKNLSSSEACTISLKAAVRP
jgi:hypothetical protein